MTSFESIRVNSWFYSPDHGQLCKVIETQSLWGNTTCRVWLPGLDSVACITAVLYRKATTIMEGQVR